MIDLKIIEILEDIEIKDNYVKLPQQLERELYVKVDELLKRVGGRWDKRKKMHEFNFEPKIVISNLLKTKIMPKKNPNAFFPTQKKEINLMMNYADVYWDGDKIPCTSKIDILEPSAGHGAIANEIRECFPNANLDVVEFSETNQIVLESNGFKPIKKDFLTYNQNYMKKYDYIFMNPPFSYKKHRFAYIEHILHAKSMLKENGVLIAIAPSSFLRNNTKIEKNFYEFVSETLSVEIIESGAFKDVGTNVETVIFKYQNKKYSQFNKYKNFISYSFILTIMNDCEKSEKLAATFVKMQEESFFDKEELATLLTYFLDQYKKENIYFPYNTEHYLDDIFNIFEMDYLENGQILKNSRKEQPNLFNFLAA